MIENSFCTVAEGKNGDEMENDKQMTTLSTSKDVTISKDEARLLVILLKNHVAECWRLHMTFPGEIQHAALSDHDNSRWLLDKISFHFASTPGWDQGSFIEASDGSDEITGCADDAIRAEAVEVIKKILKANEPVVTRKRKSKRP